MDQAARRGDWETWCHHALETGDPQFWPQIRQFYQEQPAWRWMIVSHLRFYWQPYESMVAPVLREAMRDPELCDEAIQAIEEFPSLSEEVVASLRDPECLRRITASFPQAIASLKAHPAQAMGMLKQALQDRACWWQESQCAEVAMQLAAAFPSLADEVVARLQDPEFVRSAGMDPILGCLACQLGLTEGPADQIHTEWGWQDPLLGGVRVELKRRYDLDLDKLVSEVSTLG